MKKNPTHPATPEEATDSNRLRLRRRPVADLTEKQMGDAAGGHPHPATCEETCPRTCARTCPCPDTTDPPTCPDTCGTCHTECYSDCYSECYSDCLTVCFDAGC